MPIAVKQNICGNGKFNR